MGHFRSQRSSVQSDVPHCQWWSWWGSSKNGWYEVFFSGLVWTLIDSFITKLGVYHKTIECWQPWSTWPVSCLMLQYFIFNILQCVCVCLYPSIHSICPYVYIYRHTCTRAHTHTLIPTWNKWKPTYPNTGSQDVTLFCQSTFLCL